MNKSNKKYIITAIIFLIIALVSTVVQAWTEQGVREGDYRPGYIRDVYGNFIKVAPGNKVTILVGPTFHYINSGGLNCYSILHQPNVWCIQHGVALPDFTKYVIGDKYTVNDPAIAYIINQGKKEPVTGKYYHANPAQEALWKYLFDNKENVKTTDPYLIENANVILDPSDKKNGDKLYRWDDNAAKILKDAYTYKNDLNNFSEPNVTLETSGDNLNVKVKGNFNKFDIIINGEKKGTYTDNASEGVTKSYNISTIKNNGKGIAEVTVTAYKSISKATYNLLIHSGYQRLIITDTSTSEISKTTETKISLNVNVSLQKYITKVQSADLKTTTYNSNSRFNKGTAGYGSPISNYKSAISNTNKSTNDSYKNTNPVLIENGDYVTYRIYVYNNAANIASSVKVEDTLPDNINLDRTSLNKGTCTGISRDNKSVTAEIKDLKPGRSVYFEVTVQFNKYSNKKIWNIAKIGETIPENNTKYRIEDGDSILMKKYEVSLEKYISSVNNTPQNQENTNKYPSLKAYLNNKTNKMAALSTLRNINNLDINKDNIVSLLDLELLNKYIGLSTSAIETLKKSYNLNQLNNYKLADINNDEVVNLKDKEILELYKKNLLSEDVLKAIEVFTKYDLNSDGILDEKDITYYKVSKLDVNRDGIIDNNDLYTILLLSIDLNDDTVINIVDLELLKLYLLRQNNINIQDYIKYDVNEDGIVDDDDKDLVALALNSNLLKHINDAKVHYNLENYNDLYNKIKQEMSKYDIDGNNIVDIYDISILNNYCKGSYNEYKGKTIAELEELREAAYWDEDYEKSNTITEYLFLLDEDGNFNTNYFVYTDDGEIDTNQTKLRITEWMHMMDFDQDNVVDSTDYNIVKVLSYGDKFCNEYEKTCETYKNYTIYCDLNNDGRINEQDKTIEEEQKEILNKIDTNKIVDNMKSYEFIEFANNHKDSIKDIIENADININLNIWNNYHSIYNSLSDEERNNIDITLIRNVEDEKDWINNLQNMINQKIFPDVNKDGKVTYEDAIFLQEHMNNYNVSNINVENIDENFINYFTEADIDGDGDFTTTDLELYTYFDFNKLDINKDGVLDDTDSELLIELIEIITSNMSNEDVIEIINRSPEDYSDSRMGKAEYLTEKNGQYVDNTKNDTKWTQHNSYKYNNVVPVYNGDYITYTITVKNDSLDTSIYITEITDYLPDGIMYNDITYSGGEYNKTTDNAIRINRTAPKLLAPGESISIDITVLVTEPNISVDIMKNTAKITKIKNKNNIEMNADEADSTPFNNTDSDYFQMKDITIQGTVWNDIALDKGQHNYDGIYDEKQEKKLPDIKVMLYRQGVNDPISTATTDANGRYVFDLDYIKGPKVSDTNRWAGTYYSYYVVFEYDGITYTSSLWNDVTSNNSNDSNAREDGAKVKETRARFNARFSTINNESGIEYTTINEKERAPQSKHKYDPRTMAMQSSTNLISLSKTAALEEQLQHVNLGLRGKDIFDLELKSDVYSTKVTVNNQSGVYNYGDNHITIRREDVSNKDYEEDMAHVNSQVSEYKGEQYEQGVRKTDIDVKEAGANVTPYETTGLGIEVTYKITVTNKSLTDGTATKITNYFDSRYNFERAYDSNGNTLSTNAGTSGTGYNSVIITTPRTNLSQGEQMEIYVVYTLKDAAKTLEGLVKDEVLPTYNMAEIEEYKTKCAEGQTEYTRGLLDKNSAPGSANREQARLTTTDGQNTPTINGNPTTVAYYFAARELDKLKYEDDTYSTPTLYFVAPKEDPNNPNDNGYARTITGTVFKDITTTNEETRVKTGNGKLDRGEVGVYGATVTLIELKSDNREVARYRTTTDENGKFKFSGFLPGDYIIKYEYGDTTKTVLLNQGGQDINKYSFNGEDYQSTNNTGTYGAATLNKTERFWYVYNEKDGISTATDNSDRRSDVSKMVTLFTDEEMTVLNNMRDGKNEEQSKVTYQKDGRTETVTVNNIIDKTKMDAWTAPMKLLVEKAENVDDRLVQKSVFGEYVVSNMNFGIAEVPVTEINLQKHVQSFRIVDSTGKNVIASMEKDQNGNWKTQGNVLAETFDVSIEDEKLQGAKLTVTYEITSEMTTEKNFDNKELTVPTITGIVDYIDNNLSYNPALGENSKYWELTTHNDTKAKYEESQFKGGTKPIGTVDPEGTVHTTIVKAKDGNPILLNEAGKGSATITLEKVLSATDVTVDQIVTSTAETFAYSNTVEITGLDYKNVTSPDKEAEPQRDRIRTSNRYIILPGVQHDSATSEEIVIHPPTGDSSINTIYFVIAIISLVILAGGTFGIKKFVLDNKKK